MKLLEVQNLEEFKQIDGEFKLMLVTAQDCKACTAMEPIVAKIAEDHEFPARKMDGPSNMDFMKELHVMSVPVLIYFVDNKWVYRELGLKMRQQITSKMSNLRV